MSRIDSIIRLYSEDRISLLAFCAIAACYFYVFTVLEPSIGVLVVLPFFLIATFTIILKDPFYGILIFLFVRHLVPESFLRYGSVLHLLYGLMLVAVLVVTLTRYRKASGGQYYFPDLPSAFKLTLMGFVIVIFISSWQHIFDFRHFFSTELLAGWGHVQRWVYVVLFNAFLVAILTVWLTDSMEKFKLLVWSVIVIGLSMSMEGLIFISGLMPAYVGKVMVYEVTNPEYRLMSLQGISSCATAHRLLVPLFFAFYLLVASKGRHTKWIFIVACVISLALVLTYTRIAYAAAVLGLAYLVILTFRQVGARTVLPFICIMVAVGFSILEFNFSKEMQGARFVGQFTKKPEAINTAVAKGPEVAVAEGPATATVKGDGDTFRTQDGRIQVAKGPEVAVAEGPATATVKGDGDTFRTQDGRIQVAKGPEVAVAEGPATATVKGDGDTFRTQDGRIQVAKGPEVQDVGAEKLPGWMRHFGLTTKWVRWQLIIEAFKDKPVKGWGIGTAKEVLGKYGGLFEEGPTVGPKLPLEFYSSLHNLYLKWLVETGVLGWIPLLALFFLTAKNLYTVRRDALAADNTELGRSEERRVG